MESEFILKSDPWPVLLVNPGEPLPLGSAGQPGHAPLPRPTPAPPGVIMWQLRPIRGQRDPISANRRPALSYMILYQSIRGQNYLEYIYVSCKHKLSTCWLPCHWALSPRPQTSSCPAVWTQICHTSIISLFLPQYFLAWPAPPAHQAPLCLPDGAVRQPRGAVQVQIHLKNNEIHATGRLHLVNCDKFLSKRNQTRSQSSQQFSCVSNPTLA